jgi:hypothetical protein
MNIKEWHQAFKVQLDTLDTQSALRLQPEVVDIFLNKSINKIVQNVYDEFEKNQKTSDALSTQTSLHVSTDIQIDPNNSSLFSVELPLDYYFHLQSNTIIGFNVFPITKIKDVYGSTGIIDNQGDYIYAMIPTPYTWYDANPDNKLSVKTVRHILDHESKIISSPFKRSDDTEVTIFFKLNRIYVYVPKGYTLLDFNMVYLKKPIQVSYKQYIDSDLHHSLHEQVINLAVIYALETYGSERTAAKVQIKDVN